jgi:hypothetical protein
MFYSPAFCQSWQQLTSRPLKLTTQSLEGYGYVGMDLLLVTDLPFFVVADGYYILARETHRVCTWRSSTYSESLP